MENILDLQELVIAEEESGLLPVSAISNGC